MQYVEVLVVGGGSAGWAVAGALAERGREVLVVDRRDDAMAGARWINGVPPWCFDEGGLARPEAPERWGGAHPPAFVLHVAGQGVHVRIPSPAPWHVDMRHLVARLRARALAHGARFARGAVRSIEVGARVRSVDVEGVGPIAPRLVVDASGMSGAVRRRVGAPCWPDVAPEDTCAAAQLTYAVRDPEGLARFLREHGAEPGDSIGFLGLAGGYSTLTLFTEPSAREVGVLTGTIPALGAPTGAAVLRRFVESAPWIGERRFGGQGAIPLRRPYATLGTRGVALVGDVACQVYSSHGSGVGMGLVAARTLADAVGDAADPGGDEALARYSRAFHRRHGGLLAGADAFRRLSQSLAREEVGELIAHGLLDARVLASGLAQRTPELDARSLARTIARAARRPRATARLLPTLGRVALLSILGNAAPRHDALIARLVGESPRGARIEEVAVLGAPLPE